VLFVASAVFWAAYEQAGSSLSLFAERSTNRVVLGFDFPASWFQFVPSLFVMILAPMFAWLWIALGKREPSSPAKFALGVAVRRNCICDSDSAGQSGDGRARWFRRGG
jgi:POT family proton-dependent oligopeptide transporter